MSLVVRRFRKLGRFFQTYIKKETEMNNYRQMWKVLATTKKAKSYHVAQNCVLRAIKKANNDVDRAETIALRLLSAAFTPIHRPSKIANGAQKNAALKSAVLWAQISDDILGAPKQIIEGKPEEEAYYGVFARLTPPKLYEYSNRNYVYIFVRQDISPEYQLVQAAHVAMKAGWFLRNGQSIKPTGFHPDNLYFTVIGVENDLALAEIQKQLKDLNINHHAFVEPDIGNQQTAVATYPIPVRKRGVLLKYPLLRFNAIT